MLCVAGAHGYLQPASAQNSHHRQRFGLDAICYGE
jgi:hypothetical protein